MSCNVKDIELHIQNMLNSSIMDCLKRLFKAIIN